ncbi:hypothetical protein ACCC92_26620 [Mucilaginibacter sp. Mucisp84]|uniref:hypothetical protein n=1 Tax=Mucilaginibacter sp. Mucisp84 TaxID=3243058 RepID=UPI0039A6B3CD
MHIALAVIKSVRKALKELDIFGMLWDYNSSFSLVNGRPVIRNLPLCMKDAISAVQ